MRYPFSATLVIGAALCVPAGAGDPAKLTRACPRLAPINGAPAGTLLIDNDTVLRLAKEGRFAAVARPTTLPEISQPVSSPKSALIQRWRAEYRRSATAIHGAEKRLAKAQGEFAALEARYDSLRKANQRFRLQPRLDAKKKQIGQLIEDLKHARSDFSNVIRRARLDGAQPGWFRGLQRP